MSKETKKTLHEQLWRFHDKLRGIKPMTLLPFPKPEWNDGMGDEIGYFIILDNEGNPIRKTDHEV